MAVYTFLPANRLTKCGKPTKKGLRNGTTFMSYGEQHDLDCEAELIAKLNERIPGEDGKPALRKRGAGRPPKKAKPEA